MSKRRGDLWVVQVGSVFSPQMAGNSIAGQAAWMPKIDVLECEDHLLVRVELAGVQINQVNLTYTASRHALLVRGERIDDLADREHRYHPHLLEIEEGPFAREIKLPNAEFDLDNTTARFRCGILTVIVPKRAKTTGVFVVESVTLRRT